VLFQVFSVFFLENVTNWIPNSELELNSIDSSLNSKDSPVSPHTQRRTQLNSARISNDSDDEASSTHHSRYARHYSGGPGLSRTSLPNLESIQTGTMLEGHLVVNMLVSLSPTIDDAAI
jgi:hypothetical protein